MGECLGQVNRKTNSEDGGRKEVTHRRNTDVQGEGQIRRGKEKLEIDEHEEEDWWVVQEEKTFCLGM